MNSVLSVGVNNCRGDNHGMFGTYHAETDAIRRLPQRNGKKLMKVDLIVAKTSSTHCLGDSRPCIKCVNDLMTVPRLYGYRVNKVIYSNNDGELVCRKLLDLISDKEQHITKCYRKQGYRGKYVSYCPKAGCAVTYSN